METQTNNQTRDQENGSRVEVTDPETFNRYRNDVMAITMNLFSRSGEEATLYAVMRLSERFNNSLLYMGHGTVPPAFGARSGLLWLHPGATMPEFTHDVVVNRTSSLRKFGPPTGGPFEAPSIATAKVPIPDTVGEMEALLAENTKLVGNDKGRDVFLVTGDVVVPTSFGTNAGIYLIPPRVKVRALCGQAGHNAFRLT